MGEPILGMIRMVAFNYPPKGWAFCNGQLLSINQNQALFSILGTTYGGDGQSTFALPNLQGRVPVHEGGSVALGERAGEASHTLTLSEMPAHTHVPQGNSGAGNVTTPVGNVWAQQAANPYSPAASGAMSPGAVTAVPVDSGQPHDNLQPYLVVNYVIALVGIFPSRN